MISEHTLMELAQQLEDIRAQLGAASIDIRAKSDYVSDEDTTEIHIHGGIALDIFREAVEPGPWYGNTPLYQQRNYRIRIGNVTMTVVEPRRPVWAEE